jgi:hypothetical protein
MTLRLRAKPFEMAALVARVCELARMEWRRRERG